jgi:hypothetical protein
MALPNGGAPSPCPRCGSTTQVHAAIAAGEMTEQDIELLRSAKMDPRHDHPDAQLE